MKFEEKKSVDENQHRHTHEVDAEGTGAAVKSEQEQVNSEPSFSEKVDVTPPTHKDFPVAGPGKADFESRPQGRRTARMVGHEPGTEGI